MKKILKVVKKCYGMDYTYSYWLQNIASEFTEFRELLAIVFKLLYLHEIRKIEVWVLYL